MAYIFDCSFGHARMTPDAVHAAGAVGVILYAGCGDSSKNTTRAEVQALLDVGLQVGLVIENGPQDMSEGRGLGIQYGTNLYTAAQALGYDRDDCVLFTAADWDVTTAQEAQVEQFMAGFNEVIPVPGIYGDRDALDYCATHGHAEVFWQADAMAWSGGHTSTHAHLQQRYNDPRAHGLPVDVNDVLRTDLRLMGANPLMALTDKQQTDLYNRVMGFDHQRWYVTNKDGSVREVAHGTKGAVAAHALDTLDGNYLVGQMNALAAQNTALTGQLAALAAEVKTLRTGTPPGPVTANVTVTGELTGQLHISDPAV